MFVITKLTFLKDSFLLDLIVLLINILQIKSDISGMRKTCKAIINEVSKLDNMSNCRTNFERESNERNTI
jgi:hypothetical protein